MKAIALLLLIAATAAADTTRVPTLAAPFDPTEDQDITGTWTFPDEGAFSIIDETVATKVLRFNLDGVTAANTITLTFTGTAAAPVLAIGGATIGHNGTNSNVTSTAGGILFTPGLNTLFVATTPHVGLRSNAYFGWSATTDPTAALDAILFREAAATIQFGLDVNGSAVAQTLKAHDGITGTDVAGANFTLAGGRGTGAGAPGVVRIQTAVPLATGTTAQTLQDSMVLGKVVTLTEAGGAEEVIRITTATTQSFGLELSYKVHANDATPDYAIREGSLKLVCVNNATAVTCTKDATAQTDDESVLINTTAKTLTYAIAVNVATANVAFLTFDIDSDMTVSAANITWTATLNGSGTIS